MDQRAAPRVSVIIAAYSPGDAVNRVIDSLDAQTLPQNEFEVIFVDDGSPDDTFDRLNRIASTRPNMQVHTIPNSGWPSRPRNVGIGYAKGEYLFFMDHDDSLYPDGLRRAYEYAHENDADVLSPKESKTNDVWWGMSSLTAGNLPNALAEDGIDRMLPMVPHKLYRRQMFLDNDIRFPEGARVLWEDWFINLDAFRHAKVISVLADSPVYLWHASDTNSSHTFNPARVDFWDRLEDMMDYINTVLSGSALHAAKVTAMTHQVRTRVIDRCVRLVANPSKASVATRQMGLARAAQLLARYASDEVVARLPKKHAAQLYLISAGEIDLVKEFHEADLALTANTTIATARWAGRALCYQSETRWEPRAGMAGLRLDGDRVVRAVGAAVERALPPELLDMTDDPAALVVETCIRSRAEHVTWAVPHTARTAIFETNAAGALSLVQRAEGVIDLDSAALGHPMDDTVWDVRTRTEWVGMERKGPLLYRAAAMPALMHGRSGVAYSNVSKGLSIDLAGRLRTLAVDAKPFGAAGLIGDFQAPLTNVTVAGDSSDLDASNIAAIPEAADPADPTGPALPDSQETERINRLAEVGSLHARVVANAFGARLVGSADLDAGRYRLYARRQKKWHKTARLINVSSDGTVAFD